MFLFGLFFPLYLSCHIILTDLGWHGYSGDMATYQVTLNHKLRQQPLDELSLWKSAVSEADNDGLVADVRSEPGTYMRASLGLSESGVIFDNVWRESLKYIDLSLEQLGLNWMRISVYIYVISVNSCVSLMRIIGITIFYIDQASGDRDLFNICRISSASFLICFFIDDAYYWSGILLKAF